MAPSKKSKALSKAALNIGAPPATFTLFPKLPKELQVMVWKAVVSASSPRVVEVGLKRNVHWEWRVTSPTLVPAMLHTCHESRKIGLKTFRKFDMTHFTGTYVDWERDTIFINDVLSSWDANCRGYNILKEAAGSQTFYDNCQRLAMMRTSFASFTSKTAWVMTDHPLPSVYRYAEFKKLDTLNVVHECDGLSAAGNLSLVSAVATNALTAQERDEKIYFFKLWSVPQPKIKTIDVVIAQRGNEALSKSTAKRWSKKP